MAVVCGFLPSKGRQLTGFLHFSNALTKQRRGTQEKKKIWFSVWKILLACLGASDNPCATENQ